MDLEIGGIARRVELVRGEVRLDGRPFPVDAAQAPSGWSLIVGGRSYDVALAEAGSHAVTVHVNGRATVVQVGDRRYGARKDIAEGRTEHGPFRVTAPMPGRIARVLVKPGDAVAARQGVIVIEAMKMENELRAPRAGRVADVRAVAGALVDAHAILVVIE